MLSMDIKPESDLHKTLVKAVRDRYQYSKRKMDQMRQQWNDADDSLKAYVPETETDRLRKTKKRFEGKHDFVSLEVPYVYAQVMTAHTYWSTVFLSRSPIWQFTGRHGESQDACDAVEAVHDYQTKNGFMLPVLYNWIYDWARYNLGVVGLYWDEETITVSNFVEEAPSFLGIPVPGKAKKVRKEQKVKGYSGNRLYNISPYDFYPDPRVPIWRFHEGEFVIRNTSEGWNELLACHQSMPGYYINLDYLKKKINENKASGPWLSEGSPRIDRPLQGDEQNYGAPGPGFIKIQEMYVKLVPSLWGLGDSKAVEIWCFTIAEDCVVISAKPLGALHNRFPMAIFEGNFGSDSFAKVGLVEIIRPMTDVLSWLVNSHFYNVRRTLNDTRVVDPTGVVIKDVERTMAEAGGIIRLKPAGYGKDVRTLVQQLMTQDVTRSHLNDIMFIEQMIQRAGGVVENIMGMQNASSRKSATEARISSTWSTNRLKTPADYNAALGMDPLARMMVSNTQQYLDVERKYAIAGSLINTARRFIDVNPEMISGSFDFVPVDGTLPIDPMARANFWKELIVQMARVPQFAMQWDIGGMVAHMMQMQGERNIERFRINVLPPGVPPGPNGMPVQMGGSNAASGPGKAGPPGTSGGS